MRIEVRGRRVEDTLRGSEQCALKIKKGTMS